MKDPKILCMYLPRGSLDTAGAILMTSWDCTGQTKFLDMIQDVAVGLDGDFAFETWTHQQTVHFCMTAESPHIEVLAANMYAQESNIELHQIPDFTLINPNEYSIAVADFRLRKSSIYPMNDFTALRFSSTSTYLNIFAGLAMDEQGFLQIIGRGLKDTAMLHSRLRAMRASEKVSRRFNPKFWFKNANLEGIEEAILDKCKRGLFDITFRMGVAKRNDSGSGLSPENMKTYLEDKLYSLRKSIGVWGKLHCNGWVMQKPKFGMEAVKLLHERHRNYGDYLIPKEIATMWYTPGLGEVPHTKEVLFKKAAVPQVAPQSFEDRNACMFGQSNFRDERHAFGFSRSDRRGHLYVLGKSGSGKSCLLQLLVKSDMDFGHGVAVLDPHGDLVDDILKLVPEHRLKDVILLDPSDTEYPPSFNPLSKVPDELKMRVSIGIVEIFQRLLGSTWSDRLEHILRYTTLSLLSTRGTTILSIRRMLVDERYRLMIASNIDDDVLRNFWINEFPDWAAKYHDEAVTPLLDKIGEFVTTDMIRNMVGQPINRYDFREIMDSRKILLIKVSKGILGDENSALLGAMIVAKIYQAAMSRADLPIEQRQDFYFYVDEFHNFATNSFNEILSESRKYRLNLTIANQFLNQIPESIRKTILGNVSNLLTFRVGGEDANALSTEFQPRFSPEDIIHLAFRDFYVRMTVNGEAQETFSGRTLDINYPKENYVQECIERSRKEYSLPISHVTEILKSWENEKLELLQGNNWLPRAGVNLRRHVRKGGKLLYLSFSDVTDEDLVQLKEDGYNTVVDVQLTDTNVSNAGVQNLVFLPKIAALRLDETFVTDEGLSFISRLNRLQALRLDQTQITDRATQYLTGSSLVKLSLAGTLVSDKCLKDLKSILSLKELNVQGTQITRRAVEEFRSLNPAVNVIF